MKRIGVTLLFLLSMLCVSAQNDPSSFLKKMQTTSWRKTTAGYKVPAFFSQRRIDVDDIPAMVVKNMSGKVEMNCWPLLGNWATFVANYPVQGSYLNDKVRIKRITYTSKTGVYSGYATDGRIFYMKLHIYSGGEVAHASSLVLLYPKDYQKSVGKLIDVVCKW